MCVGEGTFRGRFLCCFGGSGGHLAHLLGWLGSWALSGLSWARLGLYCSLAGRLGAVWWGGGAILGVERFQNLVWGPFPTQFEEWRGRDLSIFLVVKNEHFILACEKS